MTSLFAASQPQLLQQQQVQSNSIQNTLDV